MYNAAKLTALSALVTMPGAAAQSQDQGPIVGSIERFVEECSASMGDPAAYFDEARSQGQGSPVAVARVDGEEIYWVLDMTPPGEMYVHIGEIAGRTRVYCHMGLFNVPEVSDAAATNEMFLSWMDSQNGVDRTGGPVDLKALLAGDGGMTGEQVEMTVQVYQHLINGWGDVDAVADVAIQAGMIELSAEQILPSRLMITD